MLFRSKVSRETRACAWVSAGLTGLATVLHRRTQKKSKTWRWFGHGASLIGWSVVAMDDPCWSDDETTTAGMGEDLRAEWGWGMGNMATHHLTLSL